MKKTGTDALGERGAKMATGIERTRNRFVSVCSNMEHFPKAVVR
jgi:hypothetical protein